MLFSCNGCVFFILVFPKQILVFKTLYSKDLIRIRSLIISALLYYKVLRITLMNKKMLVASFSPLHRMLHTFTRKDPKIRYIFGFFSGNYLNLATNDYE